MIERINVLTVEEYYKIIDWFFSDKNPSMHVLKLVCHSIMGYDFSYLVKAGVKPNEDFTRDWYNNEPILQRYCKTFEELLEKENKELIEQSAGRLVRCLFHKDEIVYQPSYYIPKDSKARKEKIEEMKNFREKDCFMGFYGDPFTFVAEYKTKDDGKYIDDGRNNEEVKRYNRDENNYRVFYIEMTPEEFLDEDSRFLKHVETKSFNDGLIDYHDNHCEYTEEWQNFIKEHKLKN